MAEDKILKAYASPGVNEAVLADIDRELAQRKSGRKVEVLDLGAGEGYMASNLLSIFRTHNISGNIVCADIDRDNFKVRSENISFRTHNLNEGFSFGKFDFVIAAEIIEHLRSPYDFIKNCLESLNNDGILYITSPNVFTVSSLIKIFITGIPSFFDMNVNNEHITMSPPFIVELLTQKASMELKKKFLTEVRFNRNIFSTPFRKSGKRIIIKLPGDGNRFFGENGIYKIKSA